MADDITYDRVDGSGFLDVLDEVTDLYVEIRSDLGEHESIFTRESFIERTTRQTRRDGFAAVLARCGGTLVGFAFGFHLPAGGWWAGDAEKPPAEILDAAKFAVIELDVAAAWRGRGIGRTLHHLLLEDRPEQYAVLTAIPEAPARAMYARWGWEQHGTAQHADDAPVMDQLVLRLHG